MFFERWRVETLCKNSFGSPRYKPYLKLFSDFYPERLSSPLSKVTSPSISPTSKTFHHQHIKIFLSLCNKVKNFTVIDSFHCSIIAALLAHFTPRKSICYSYKIHVDFLKSTTKLSKPPWHWARSSIRRMSEILDESSRRSHNCSHRSYHDSSIDEIGLNHITVRQLWCSMLIRPFPPADFVRKATLNLCGAFRA